MGPALARMYVAAACAVMAIFGLIAGAAAQRDSSGPPTDRISALSRQIEAGDVRLTFDPDNGYLRSLLTALRVPVESQVVVFSQTSMQFDLISPRNPRAVFFSDDVALGWVRGADTVELAALDAEQGVVFYTLEQRQSPKPQIKRETSRCFVCHLSPDTLGVPGLLTFSTFSIPQDKYSYAAGAATDHRTPMEDRWGGWYVTGRAGSMRHLANAEVPQSLRSQTGKQAQPRQLDSLEGLFDLRGFPTRHSDVVALMVLEHQTRMTNLLARLASDARSAMSPEPLQAPLPRKGPARSDPNALRDTVNELVDYLLFVDEAPLGRIRGSAAFAEKFSSGGRLDRKGRSLRQLDLDERLMRYPCSYMINTEAFDRLPRLAKDLVYERMWAILSGRERGAPYSRLSLDDRRAIVEILKDTKGGLPSYFAQVTQ